MTLKCDHCDEPAVVFAPGTEEQRDLFLLVRGVPTRAWCLACAKRAGWPFPESRAA